MRRRTRLIVGIVLLVLLCGSLAWLPGRQTIPPAEDESWIQEFLMSPFSIAIIWPMAFVTLEIALGFVASTKQLKADGTRKFVAWFKHRNGDSRRFAIGPLDIAWLKNEFDNNDHDILDIDILPPSILETFDFGIDLCVSALATDLATLLAVQGGRVPGPLPINTLKVAAVFVIHLVIAAMIVSTLATWSGDKSEKRRKWAIRAANAMGFLAILSSFGILGNLIGM